jgi:hypothetical protein
MPTHLGPQPHWDNQQLSKMFYQVTATAGLRFSTRIWRQLVSSIAQIKLSEI